jgi:hypothetical protein
VKGQYSKSPLKKNEPEFFWKNVPKENIKGMVQKSEVLREKNRWKINKKVQ